MSIVIRKQADRCPLAYAGEALAVGNLVALDSNGKYVKADANGEGLWPAIGIVTMACDSGGRPEVSRDVVLENSAWTLTVGAPIYLSTTAGAVTDSAPNTAGDCVQCLGTSQSATRVVFKITEAHTIVPAA